MYFKRERHLSLNALKSGYLMILVVIPIAIYLIVSHSNTNKKQAPNVTSSENRPTIIPVTTSEMVSGVVEYTFISSVLSSGLTNNELKSLLSLLGDNFDIIKSVNNGDKFSIKTQNNGINQEYVSAFYYLGSDIEFFAMRGADDNIYNENGYKLNNDYVFPLPLHFRVSSPFDLNRKHPITNRITPHFGTDYATPIGTKIRSLSDGVVLKSRYNRFAGNYLTIKHTDGNYARYLHLSERHVLTGDFITKGQIIGLTGNSGRTTGPHLHLELSVAGVPVNFEQYINSEKGHSNQFIYIAQTEHKQLKRKLVQFIQSNQPST
ncbi:peptidoglycan DD-metalloendopeptidase family protein [Vibrio sp. SNU_ST1]|uniref:peptidoglycan DD-metalloendopeptidase family protein n=1 Tax=Vibrio sp. SNU_ST1 TaxID=3064001 RepID=UPI00272B36EF|nr:peptidoglycan DD-metalloendopeptidase family protein [Vibrio sp. SNU_ST1]WKY59655.1 peptidoglycan DD-metalloendopeptidase family protein [Vibrio sp. SNU_ST1]